MPLTPPPPTLLHICPVAPGRGHRVASAASPPGVARLTWAGLWARLPAGRPLRTLSASAALGLVRAALAASRPPLQAAAQDPVAVAQASARLSGWRAAGVVAAALSPDRSSAQLAPWAELLGLYEAQLAQQGACDLSERRRWQLLALAEAGPPAGLRDVVRIEVDWAASWGAAELDLLRLWGARGAAVRLHLAWHDRRPAAFAWSEPALQAVEALPHFPGEMIMDDLAGSGPLADWRFASMAPDLAPSCSAARRRRVAAETAGGEVEAAVSEVARCLQAGAAPGDIAVVVAHPGRRLALAHALAAAGAPSCTAQLQPLTHAALGRLFFAGLAAASGATSPLASAALALWRAAGCSEEDDVGGSFDGAEARSPSGISHGVAAGADAGAAGALLKLAASPSALARRLEAAGVGGQLQAWHPSVLASVLGAELGVRMWAAWCALLARAALPPATPAAWPGRLRGWLGHLAGRLSTGEDGGPLPGWAVDRHAAAARQLADCIDGLQAAMQVATSGPAWQPAEAVAWLRLAASDCAVPASRAVPGGVHLLAPAAAIGGAWPQLVLVDAFDTAAWGPAASTFEPLLADLARAIRRRVALLSPARRPSGQVAVLATLAAAQQQLVWIEPSSDPVFDPISGQTSGRVSYPAAGSAAVPAPPPQAASEYSCVPRTALLRAWVRQYGARCDAASRRQHGALAPPEAALAELAARLQASGQASAGMALGSLGMPRLRRLLQDRLHPAGELAELGRCSFRWAALALWGLGEPRAAAPMGQAVQEGALVHRALSAVYSRIIGSGGLAAARAAPAAALEQARQITAGVAMNHAASSGIHPDAAPALAERAGQTVCRQLQADLQAAPAAAALEPQAVGWAFEVSLPAGPGRLRATGTIDRLDTSADRLRLVDYVRRAPTPAAQPGPRAVQLAVWVQAALAARPPAAPKDVDVDVRIQAVWSPLLQGRRAGPPALSGGCAEVAATANAMLSPLLAAAWDGRLAAQPSSPGGCRGCHLAALCRRRADPAAEAASLEAQDEL